MLVSKYWAEPQGGECAANTGQSLKEESVPSHHVITFFGPFVQPTM